MLLLDAPGLSLFGTLPGAHDTVLVLRFLGFPRTGVHESTSPNSTEPDDDENDVIMKSMAGTFKITDEGSLADYLGVKIRKDEQGNMILTQTHMIESILNDLDVNLEIYAKCTTLAMPSKLLTRDTDGKEFVRDWEYRSVIGKLNYQKKSQVNF